jgi:hypothetical protein
VTLFCHIPPGTPYTQTHRFCLLLLACNHEQSSALDIVLFDITT